MPDHDENRDAPAEQNLKRFRHVARARSLVLLAVVSCIVGSFTGFIVAMFRIALMRADIWRHEWIARAHSWPVGGVLLTVGVAAAAAACATWLVGRFSPDAAFQPFSLESHVS